MINERKMRQTTGLAAAGAGGRRCCTGFALSVVSGFNGVFIGTARSSVAEKRPQKQRREIQSSAAHYNSSSKQSRCHTDSLIFEHVSI